MGRAVFPPCCLIWGQTVVEVMKMTVTSFKRSCARTATLSALDPAAATASPRLCQRLLDTHGQVWIGLLWGHCSFLLDPGGHKILFVASKSLFPQSCVSSGSSMVGWMVTSSKRAYAKPRSAAPRAPAPAVGHCWPMPLQETLKHSKADLAQLLITWSTVLSNSLKLWAVPCRATQEGQVMVESSDKTWSTGEGNDKALQYSCLENPMNSMKRQGKKIGHQKWTVQYATGDQWRNNSRKNEETEPKQKQHPVVGVTGNGSKIWCCKEQYCIGTWNVRSMHQGKLEVVKQETVSEYQRESVN